MRSNLGTDRRGKEPVHSAPARASERDSVVDVRKQVTRLVICCVALAGWAVFIFCMSANDGTASMGLSDGVTAWFANTFWPGFSDLSPADQLAFVESLSFPVRKAAHFSEYAVLGLLAFATIHQVGKVLQVRRGHARSGAFANPAVPAGRRVATAVDGGAGSQGATASASRAPRAHTMRPASRTSHALLPQAAVAVAFAFLYACLDEFHQLFVAGRCGQPFDVAVDTSGALVAVVAALLVSRYRTCRRSSRSDS